MGTPSERSEGRPPLLDGLVLFRLVPGRGAGCRQILSRSRTPVLFAGPIRPDPDARSIRGAFPLPPADLVFLAARDRHARAVAPVPGRADPGRGVPVLRVR